MHSTSLQKASAMPPEVKQALEVLLGRGLEADESVSVRVYRPRHAPQGEARTTAYRRLLDRIDRTAERVKDVPEAEIDAAIDEAAHFVRHSPE
jgi:hypothetical protein